MSNPGDEYGNPLGWDPSMGGAPPAYGVGGDPTTIPSNEPWSLGEQAYNYLTGQDPRVPQGKPLGAGLGMWADTVEVIEDPAQDPLRFLPSPAPWALKAQSPMAPAAREEVKQVARQGLGPARPRISYAGVPGDLVPGANGLYYQDPDTYLARLDAARKIGTENELIAGLNQAGSKTNAAMGWAPGEAPKPKAGGISQAQHDALRKKFTDFENSSLGLTGRIEREKLRGSEERGNLAMQGIDAEREALDKATYGRGIADLHAQQMEKEREVYRQRYKEEQDKRLGDIEKLNDEIGKTEIDPDRLWNRRSPAANVFSIIGLALGGLAQGWSGGRLPNTALEMLQKSIDRDIDAQKTNLQNKRASLESKRGIYAMARERFGDDEMAHNYAKATLLDQAERMAQRYASEAYSKKHRLAGQELASQLAEEKKVYQLNVQLRAQTMADEQARRAAAAASARAAGVKKTKPGELARYMPWAKGFAADPKTARDMNSAHAETQALLDMIDRLRTLRTTGSTGNPWSVDRAEYDALKTKALLTMKETEKLGVLSESDAALLNQMLPDAELFSLDHLADKKLESVAGRVEDKWRKRVNDTVVVPAELDTAAPTDRGEYAPQHVVTPEARPAAPVQFNPVR